jgi:O-antigen biosynthesis protein
MAEPAARPSDIVASVVVPVHRLGPPLDRCLRTLEELRFENDRYEIVVVTDRIDPGTYLDDFRVRQVSSPGAGPSAARNAGIDVALGEFVAFTDSDCLVDEHWLTELLACFTEEDIAGAGGSQQSPDDECPFGLRVQRLFEAISFVGGYTREHARTREVDHNPSCNAMVRKRVLDELGGFDESLFPGEDLDLDIRIRRRALRLVYNPAARVFHYRPKGLGGFARMMERYGRFSGGILTRRHGVFRLLSLEPLAAVLGLSAWAGLAVLSPPAAGAAVVLASAALFLYFLVRCGGPVLGLQCLGLLLVLLWSWNLGYVRGFLAPPRARRSESP